MARHQTACPTPVCIQDRNPRWSFLEAVTEGPVGTPLCEEQTTCPSPFCKLVQRGIAIPRQPCTALG
eukprot:15451949-Alexandrium_andersonii.AAC.1